MADKRVVYVEFRDGRPFSVLTEDSDGSYDGWDFEYCRRDDCLYYDLSGGRNAGSPPLSLAPTTRYWAISTLQLQIQGGQRLKRLPAPYGVRTLFAQGVGCRTEYCSICDDQLPDDGYGDPCEHLWWCNECGGWAGPGAEDYCPHPPLSKEEGG